MPVPDATAHCNDGLPGLHLRFRRRQRARAHGGVLEGSAPVTGSFSQSVTDANGRRGDESRGTLALEAPRQFRWETTAPYQQTIVADGTRVWVYEPDLQQVSVRRQSSQEAHSPLTVLTDLSQLDRDFTASEAGDRDGLAWLKLTSKAKEPEFEYAELGFDAQVAAAHGVQGPAWQHHRNPLRRLEAQPAAAARPVHVHAAERRRCSRDLKPDADVFPIGN